MNDESTMIRRDTEPSCRTRSLKLAQLNGVHSGFFKSSGHVLILLCYASHVVRPRGASFSPMLVEIGI